MQCRSVTFAWHWDESGGECSNGAARKVICPGLGWSGKLHSGFPILESVILIRGCVLALLPEARAGCSNPARPDPWRGLWATMIPTPTCSKCVEPFSLNLEPVTLSLEQRLCFLQSVS